MKFKSIFNMLIALAFVLGLFASPARVTAQSTPAPAPQDGEYVPGELIVTFASGQTQGAYQAQAAGLARSLGAQVVEMNNYGRALLQAAPGANVARLVQTARAQSGVRFAEPNRIYRLPEAQPIVSQPLTNTDVRRQSHNGETTLVPVRALQDMRTRVGNSIRATYPNDPGLWSNGGWTAVGAEIVWPNTTASKYVCEIDTGVDYTHPDLSGQILLGRDFVNEDTIPMDDNGHGTHVAGIIVAKQNNKLGMAGVAYNTKVVAVKALDAQGMGTTWDVAQAIYYCANRTDVFVINMSLGGPAGAPGYALYDSVDYAVNLKGKLIVAAAGNDNTDDTSLAFPAAYGDDDAYPVFANKVLAVAASGQATWVDGNQDGDFEDNIDFFYYEYSCRAGYSNYGSWIDIIAPGTEIYSTTPYDKPFSLNFNYGYDQRYAMMSGTSMASPFAAAVAARAWGYLVTAYPLVAPAKWDNFEVAAWIKTMGRPAYGDDSCWPASMNNAPIANVAAALERGAMSLAAVDAYTGLPLDAATVYAYKLGTTTLGGSAVITRSVYTSPYSSDVFTYFTMGTDIINLSTKSPTGYITYTPKVHKAGYTASPQAAFVNRYSGYDPAGNLDVYPGSYSGWPIASLPPSTGDFAVVSTWSRWTSDFDQLVWLPNPALTVTGQPSTFIVHNYWGAPPGLNTGGGAIAGMSAEGSGSLGWFPFTRQMFESAVNQWNWESTSIKRRITPTTLPKYNGTYAGMLTDYGQFYDDNGNGVEDPGEMPLLQLNNEDVSMFVWKDGVIKLRVNKTAVCDTGEHWWDGVRITSGTAGVPTYTAADQCMPLSGTYPYGSFNMTAIPINPAEIRWFVGLGSGTDPAQVDLEQQVVDDFNASQSDIHVTLDVVPYDEARDTLAAEFAADAGPDIVGPVGWASAAQFHGEWADLSPYLSGFDTSIFDPALMSMYNTDEGQVGLPFAVYPSVMYFQPALFDAAGLYYPPQHYGDLYEMPDHSMVAWSWDTVAQVAKMLTLDGDGDNALSSHFNADNIVQYGYSPVWESHASYIGSYFTAGSLLQGTPGAYTASAPDAWKAAWQWFYDGVWGAQPYIPTGVISGGADFDNGNTFASGKIGMAVLPSWYLCCLSDMVTGGYQFQLAVLPSYNGTVHGRVDADTFRVWNGSPRIAQAVEFYKYLVTVGIDKLVVGSGGNPPAYGALPAVTTKQQTYLDNYAAQYPFVTQASLDLILAGVSYPDIPSAEGYMPNFTAAWNRLSTFGDLMYNTNGLDLPTEIATLESDLTTIFNTP